MPDATDQQPLQISPTDIAQFIRLEQCERYLRLQLYRRNVSASVLEDYGVTTQSIPALLTRSGARFEALVEEAVAERFWKINFVDDLAHGGQRQDDNQRVIEIAAELGPNEPVFLFQPRLSVRLGRWQIRGDADVLRLERDSDGHLHVLIADMKSSTSTKVEHRLQVAFYHEMLAALFTETGVAHGPMEIAILYRGPAHEPQHEAETVKREEHYAAAERSFGARVGLLEVVADAESYRAAVHDLVTAPGSTAERIGQADFAELPFALTVKCDGCLFNEFCMKSVAEQDDLSLLPYLAPEEKAALQRHGISTMRELAALKVFRAEGDGPAHHSELVAAPGTGDVVRRLAATWPVGPRLDELVVRAKRYRAWKLDEMDTGGSMPTKGYGSLPYSDAEQNPNLVRVYIDAQHDYLHDRVYLLGALVVASQRGVEKRRRSVVKLAEGPPDTDKAEEDLFLGWVDDTMRAIVELAFPDDQGAPHAPMHVIFWNSYAQRVLLDGLARHSERVLVATPLYDFVTQLAAFDSPIASFLETEIRERKNYPMACQSLQAVAAYRKFDWNEGVRYRDLFRTRIFDFWGKFDDPPREGEWPWYFSRARFNSQIPLEYAYAAWGELEQPSAGKQDDFAPYRAATPALLAGFHARRLDAMEYIAQQFTGNKQTTKTAFRLPDLSSFEEKAQTLAQALDQFVTIERHVELSEWKTAHLPSPERRVLAGVTLLTRYCEDDQDPEVAERNRENLGRWFLKEEYEAQARALNPNEKPTMTKEQKEETRWSQEGMHVRLRFECAGLDCDLDEMVALSTFKPDEHLIVSTRTTVDSRLPTDQQVPFTPTPKQMLYDPRAMLRSIHIDRDGEGRAVGGWVEVEMAGTRGASNARGFAFMAYDEPFVPGEVYSLDADPTNWHGYHCAKVTEGLANGGENALYDYLTHRDATRAAWPAEAAEAQQRFMEGLDALRSAGAMHDFEVSKREYIGRHGDAAVLLVQGPPGTGKSYATAFALFARIQGAMAVDRDFRAFLCCRTHAATDVLLRNVLHVQGLLRELRFKYPDIFAVYFDERLLSVTLFRADPKEAPPDGVISLYKKEQREKGSRKNVDDILARRWCVVATTPGGIYRMINEQYKSLFGHQVYDCLVLDEASQMNLPEAMMAALPLKHDGQLVVVGDHRQMPPIVKHDWSTELRRTFKEYRTYESLFLWLLGLRPPMIKFEESFRLHADMAEFLRREVYVHDGIHFHSRQRRELSPVAIPDPFVAAVLSPQHSIVTVVHDEVQSLKRNPFEQALIEPVLHVLADPAFLGLDPQHGLGVVVPHRAQRAALQEALPVLAVIDPATGLSIRSAVDTVERFQGDERDAILVSATESDPQYVLLASEFLLDPRRLTVALSRAKRKMVLVASRSVFSVFSPDEETFTRSQLWKNLLRHTCTVKLWEGERCGHQVEVWGNAPVPCGRNQS